MKTEAWVECRWVEVGCMNGRVTESTDLNYAKWRLVGSKKAGRKMIGQEY